MQVETEKVVRCRHGADCSLRIVTTRTDREYITTATQNFCKLCVAELARIPQEH